MPELPEVETTKEGIKIHLEGKLIKELIVRNPQLRIPVPRNINALCKQKMILSVNRRAKYILLDLGEGHLLLHLGMSGHLRMLPSFAEPGKHDHIDLVLEDMQILRYCDPRRFGLFHYFSQQPDEHPLLHHLGPEPLSVEFNSDYLYQQTRKKRQPVKAAIMNNELVVGVGNIYAAESLFMSNIHPLNSAQRLSKEQCDKLSYSIKQVLQAAIQLGGTTLKDFYSFLGKPGYFINKLYVYGRKGKPCLICSTSVETTKIAGRQSNFCPKCQQEPLVYKA